MLHVPDPPECRHFARRGSCMYGSSCRFAHTRSANPAPSPPADEPDLAVEGLADAFYSWEAHVNDLRRSDAPRAEILAAVEELQRRRAAWNALRTPLATSRYARRPKLRNREAAGVFRRFLHRVYGADVLGGVVVDVAGGIGSLGFELANLHGADVTVVDPRPPSYGRILFKWSKLASFPEDGFGSVATRGEQERETEPEPEEPAAEIPAQPPPSAQQAGARRRQGHRAPQQTPLAPSASASASNVSPTPTE